MNFDGAAHGIYDAPELDESAVPGITNLGIKKRLSRSFELRPRAFFVNRYFVDRYQAAGARDIHRQSPLYMLVAQDAPPGLGETELLI